MKILKTPEMRLVSVNSKFSLTLFSEVLQVQLSKMEGALCNNIQRLSFCSLLHALPLKLYKPFS